MELAWWHWMVLGMALVALEMVVSTFFLLWFGMAALLVGLLMLIAAPGFATQMLLWAVLSVVMTAIWVKYFRNPDRTRAGQAKEGVKGLVGIMSREITELHPGEIMFQRPVLGADRWPAVSDKPIAQGERARVVDVEGQTLIVEKLGG
jgi:membrane protein implicated in regulation of membrane protease activity